MKLEIVQISDTILPKIQEYRNAANYTTHEMSRSDAGNPEPCSDIQVAAFIHAIAEGKDMISLIVSDIDWIEFGNCVGDKLYPVEIQARKIPGEPLAYWVNITGLNIEENFILRGW